MTEQYRNALPKGFRLSDFEIETVLGAGGFGITYRAHDKGLNRKVALKEYFPRHFAMRGEEGSMVHPVSEDFAEDYDFGLARFGDEAQTLVNFGHPNIVSVQRFFEANGTAYLVMQLVDGKSLFEILSRRMTLPEGEIIEILLALLDGLEQVHEAGFLHRDIKPRNIAIRNDGTPILLDFGAARHALREKGVDLTSIITPGYSPIEQYESDGNQGEWTDIYAMAAVLYRCVTGAKPPGALDRVRRDKFVPASRKARKKYSASFLAVIDAALAMDETTRPQTIAQWRAMFPEHVAPASTGIQ